MIEVKNLSKSYGDFRAVDDVSFVCQPGRVTGFLGPNGAGKSTAMRMITGLTRPSSGTATIGGVNYADIPNPASQVGVLLDASAQHGGRTGREVLTIGAQTMGLPSARVDEMLALVGLTPKEAKRRVRNYSLGMRQRLGIAHALLGDPRVLILDEPANGLDPAGIHWMRQLLREYANRGGTVMLSSHLLHEIQIIADDLILIGHGRIVSMGTKDDLLRTTGSRVRARDNAALIRAMQAAGLEAVQTSDAVTSPATPEEVGLAAAAAGVPLLELREADGAGLEAKFLQLTADDQRDVIAAEGALA
ncbi:ATP-binding cassette domain-containing protein [Aeromicrobium sp. 636]|uniref:ATP-binding cassette domain-containing protein n=1 Tax=Aeromicrobium senzhongii TaxID=2663859 RepID=A0A8I0ESR4_9ACTN|nr:MULTISPECIES: ATP-binding cassette domain-containing protein [Aeromicrobium]MBC9224741.1 ATP-binding cassette domain-containing protein [Aeromicrobium senzhongii]MCQ3996854.1 ATP-binding cassette domain-containing protein [Aeromicrobium sp. 636]MTB86787.1 ATP-binding cassette domain-containing protein [Aeromicrobium senzhongii]QNL93370.1 ATP-binding cassette domain-containing protein [Aeromicrobium senzhongii]